MAAALHNLTGGERIDGLIIDNQLGRIEYRIPATAARVQHRLVERMFPETAAEGGFSRFKDALRFYDDNVRSFCLRHHDARRGSRFSSTGSPAPMCAPESTASWRPRTWAPTCISRRRSTEGRGFVFTPPPTRRCRRRHQHPRLLQRLY